MSLVASRRSLASEGEVSPFSLPITSAAISVIIDWDRHRAIVCTEHPHDASISPVKRLRGVPRAAALACQQKFRLLRPREGPRSGQRNSKRRPCRGYAGYHLRAWIPGTATSRFRLRARDSRSGAGACDPATASAQGGGFCWRGCGRRDVPHRRRRRVRGRDSEHCCSRWCCCRHTLRAGRGCSPAQQSKHAALALLLSLLGAPPLSWTPGGWRGRVAQKARGLLRANASHSISASF